ncbi:hypothetical protein ACJ73_01498 [Blastomyces percursus]|uniref:Uncharacterized protein n=1 Tax=Blastomyces percursus TaxID=1658174 RepID=A0A1J9QG84_9EURO|nr:hypothetical protein ACJ73_01498 [Blastomyces percursus]
MPLSRCSKLILHTTRSICCFYSFYHHSLLEDDLAPPPEIGDSDVFRDLLLTVRPMCRRPSDDNWQAMDFLHRKERMIKAASATILLCAMFNPLTIYFDIACICICGHLAHSSLRATARQHISIVTTSGRHRTETLASSQIRSDSNRADDKPVEEREDVDIFHPVEPRARTTSILSQRQLARTPFAGLGFSGTESSPFHLKDQPREGVAKGVPKQQHHLDRHRQLVRRKTGQPMSYGSQR